jgi:hypothetical protein
MAGNVQTHPCDSFLELIRGPDRDLFDWDDEDDFELCRVFVKDDLLGLYTQDWNRYMVEIDPKTWVQIGNMTRTASRIRNGSEEYDMRIRLTAMLLKYSFTPIASQKIFAPLHLNPIFDDFPFASMACVVDENYKEQTSLADLESAESWATPHLQNWLSTRQETLCHTIWRTSPHLSVLTRVQVMELVLTGTALPQVSSSSASLD